jgi:hypothetical protein
MLVILINLFVVVFLEKRNANILGVKVVFSAELIEAITTNQRVRLWCITVHK